MRLSTTGRAVTASFAMAAALWAAAISVASAERITNFDVDVVVAENSDLMISERITYDFEGAQRHGIFREVLSEHAQEATSWYKTRSIELEPLQVNRNGVEEPWQDEGSGGDMYLRIGDANRTITGEHMYEIVYTVRGALSVYDDGLAEVYWNVTGSEWEVPIDAVQVTVAAAGRASLAPQAACYTGTPGSTGSCSEIILSDRSTVFRETDLYPGSQLTVAQAVEHPDWQVSPVAAAANPSDFYDEVTTAVETPIIIERINWLPFVLGSLVLGIIGVIIFVYRWRTHYDPHASIIAQYEPYEDFKPMFTGVLIDGKLDSRDITAGILYLAQQGFITIKQTNEKILGLFNTTDYEVTLARPFDQADTRFGKDLLTLLFAGQPAVDRSGGWRLFSSFSTKARAEAAAMPVGKTIRLSDIKKNQSKLRSNALLLQALNKDAKEDLIESGFYVNRASNGILWGIPVTIVSALMVGFFVGSIAAALFSPILIAVSLIAATTQQRRTTKGYEARNHLLGFKDFLSVTDKDRYKFHNAPDKNPQQFMEYLPYAIAFAVEKEWAEVFKDISIPTPEWYSSNVAGAHFSATDFTSDLSSFSSSLASSGSSSSGSGGGGSAGGGSGGGGGGSW